MKGETGSSIDSNYSHSSWSPLVITNGQGLNLDINQQTLLVLFVTSTNRPNMLAFWLVTHNNMSIHVSQAKIHMTNVYVTTMWIVLCALENHVQ